MSLQNSNIWKVIVTGKTQTSDLSSKSTRRRTSEGNICQSHLSSLKDCEANPFGRHFQRHKNKEVLKNS